MFIDFLRLCGKFLLVQRNPPPSISTDFLPTSPFLLLLLLTLGRPSSSSFSIACPFSESVTSLQLRFAIFLATPESHGLARLALPESPFQRGCVALTGPVPPTPTPATESPRRRIARRGTLLSRTVAAMARSRFHPADHDRAPSLQSASPTRCPRPILRRHRHVFQNVVEYSGTRW